MSYVTTYSLELFHFNSETYDWELVTTCDSWRKMLHACFARDLWCEHRRDTATIHAPWHHEGGDVDFSQLWYPVYDGNIKDINPDYRIRRTEHLDDRTMAFMDMVVLGDSVAAHVALLELNT